MVEVRVEHPAGAVGGDELGGGRYRLIAPVGQGGMGTVWRAYDTVLQRHVAIKRTTAIAATELGDPIGEARAAARLDHSNVVRVYDVFHENDRNWIVMEFVDGRSLHDAILQDGPLSHPAAARIGVAVLNALRAAQSAGVVHRDVKPQNVLIATDGRALLTDFGLAALHASSGRSGAREVLGSPFFIAPERLSGDDAGLSGDLWSLGATLYAAVEGRPPFRRDTVAASLTAALHEPIDPVGHPGPLHPVIRRLLVKDPAQRMGALDGYLALRNVADRSLGVATVPGQRPPPTSDAGRSTAAAIAAALSSPARTARPRTHRRRRLIVGAAAAAVAAGLAGGVAIAVHHGPAAPEVPAQPAPVAAVTVICPPVAGAIPTAAATGPYALPSGWTWLRDPLGFRVPVPPGWTRTATRTGARFCDPAGRREFTVDLRAPVTGTPLQYWQSAEAAAEKTGVLPDYRRVSMDVVLLDRGGADWQYTWQPVEGPRRQTRRLLLATSATRAYVLQWQSAESDWAAFTTQQRAVLAGFG